MALLETPAVELGKTAPDFNLPGVDGKPYTLQDCVGKNGLVVIFMCNHCPYVKAIMPRLIEDVRTLDQLGIGVVGICANDPENYPADSFENMQRFAKEHALNFPYLQDLSQEVASAYGAVCTPDLYGFDKDLKLQYRGRLDSGRSQTAPVDAKRELVEAMKMIMESGKGPQEQFSSMGCSIKWR